MKIVNIIGGLGNQMFQYSFALSLSFKFPNEKILIDRSHFNKYVLHNGFELESIFGLNLPVASKSDLKKVTYYIPNYKLSRLVRRILPKRRSECVEKQGYIYDPLVFEKQGDVYYEGYWQSYKYFDEVKDVILKKFSFPDFIDEKNLELANLIGSTNSVSIHIRRGDYVGAERYKGICTDMYYKNAIGRAKDLIANPCFFVFSDDIDWCRNNLPSIIGESAIYYVDNNKGKNSFFDMKLMSLSKCQIIANSSFSWWSAYLNQQANHIIIAPSRWVNDIDINTDIICPDWITI